MKEHRIAQRRRAAVKFWRRTPIVKARGTPVTKMVLLRALAPLSFDEPFFIAEVPLDPGGEVTRIASAEEMRQVFGDFGYR